MDILELDMNNTEFWLQLILQVQCNFIKIKKQLKEAPICRIISIIHIYRVFIIPAYETESAFLVLLCHKMESPKTLHLNN